LLFSSASLRTSKNYLETSKGFPDSVLIFIVFTSISV
jgi:hypothetical protein